MADPLSIASAAGSVASGIGAIGGLFKGGRKLNRTDGVRHRQYLEGTFPELTPWELAGTPQSGSTPSADASLQNTDRLANAQILTNALQNVTARSNVNEQVNVQNQIADKNNIKDIVTSQMKGANRDAALNAYARFTGAKSNRNMSMVGDFQDSRHRDEKFRNYSTGAAAAVGSGATMYGLGKYTKIGKKVKRVYNRVMGKGNYKKSKLKGVGQLDPNTGEMKTGDLKVKAKFKPKVLNPYAMVLGELLSQLNNGKDKKSARKHFQEFDEYWRSKDLPYHKWY